MPTLDVPFGLYVEYPVLKYCIEVEVPTSIIVRIMGVPKKGMIPMLWNVFCDG